MTTTDRPRLQPRPDRGAPLSRLSARFGIAFTACQLLVMIVMAVFVLPSVGSPATRRSSAGRPSSTSRPPTA